jgi:hypothetical protein
MDIERGREEPYRVHVVAAETDLTQQRLEAR